MKALSHTFGPFNKSNGQKIQRFLRYKNSIAQTGEESITESLPAFTSVLRNGQNTLNARNTQNLHNKASQASSSSQPKELFDRQGMSIQTICVGLRKSVLERFKDFKVPGLLKTRHSRVLRL
jgi:hypothetical protein